MTAKKDRKWAKRQEAHDAEWKRRNEARAKRQEELDAKEQARVDKIQAKIRDGRARNRMRQFTRRTGK